MLVGAGFLWRRGLEPKVKFFFCLKNASIGRRAELTGANQAYHRRGCGDNFCDYLRKNSHFNVS